MPTIAIPDDQKLASFRAVSITLDTANSFVTPLRLSAGDINGRQLRVIVTDDGAPVDPEIGNTLTAALQWNSNPSDSQSAGGYEALKQSYTTDSQLVFTGPIPRALLQQATQTTVIAIAITAGDTVICSRTIPVVVDPSVLRATAPDIADPLAELHKATETAAKIQTMLDTASITAGTTATLAPNKQATSSLTGAGLSKILDLGIPRGAGIATATAETLSPLKPASAVLSDRDDGDKDLKLGIPRGAKPTGVSVSMLDADAKPTAAVTPNADGDYAIALGIPRGPQGLQGEKGDPGDASTIASASAAGVVKVDDTQTPIRVDDDGLLGVNPGQGIKIVDYTAPIAGAPTIKTIAANLEAGAGITIVPSSAGNALVISATDGDEGTQPLQVASWHEGGGTRQISSVPFPTLTGFRDPVDASIYTPQLVVSTWGTISTTGATFDVLGPADALTALAAIKSASIMWVKVSWGASVSGQTVDATLTPTLADGVLHITATWPQITVDRYTQYLLTIRWGTSTTAADMQAMGIPTTEGPGIMGDTGVDPGSPDAPGVTD